MERETGIEPALVAWKATVLPLNYSRPGGTFYFGGGVPIGSRQLRQTILTNQNRWREVGYSEHPAIAPALLYLRHPCRRLPFALLQASLRLFKIAPGDFVEPAALIHLNQFSRTTKLWWREVDSNHRRHEPADLQSAPVGRLGIPPNIFKTSLNTGRREVDYPGHPAIAPALLYLRSGIHAVACPSPFGPVSLHDMFKIVRDDFVETGIPLH